MPFFSIIIPTLNSAKTLDVALHSILQQSFTDFEILIIDSLSTDNTIEIARSYCDARIRIITEEDTGIYDAMNKGIGYARGEWLYFMGSDDRLYNKDIIKNLSKYFEDEKLDIIYGNVKFLISGRKYDNKFSTLKLLYRNICHQAIFTRKRVFEFLGRFETEYKGLADWHFNMKWFNDKRIKHIYIDDIIAYYYEDGFCFNNTDNKFYQDWRYNVAKYFKWNVRLLYKLSKKKIVQKLLLKNWT